MTTTFAVSMGITVGGHELTMIGAMIEPEKGKPQFSVAFNNYKLTGAQMTHALTSLRESVDAAGGTSLPDRATLASWRDKAFQRAAEATNTALSELPQQFAYDGSAASITLFSLINDIRNAIEHFDPKQILEGMPGGLEKAGSDYQGGIPTAPTSEAAKELLGGFVSLDRFEYHRTKTGSGASEKYQTTFGLEMQIKWFEKADAIERDSTLESWYTKPPSMIGDPALIELRSFGFDVEVTPTTTT
jgi:hypothetical protein